MARGAPSRAWMIPASSLRSNVCPSYDNDGVKPPVSMTTSYVRVWVASSRVTENSRPSGVGTIANSPPSAIGRSLTALAAGVELSDRRRVGDPEPELGVVIGERGEAARRRVGVSDRQGTSFGAGGDRAIRGRHEGDVDRRPGPVVILVVDARRIELGRVGAVGVGDDRPEFGAEGRLLGRT